MKKILFIVLISAIAGAGAWLWYKNYHTKEGAGPALLNKVSYLCRDKKTIDASFYQGTPKPQEAGMPPIPSGSVAISLSDGRSMTLPQTISASGIRYANADESFMFWGKGNGAFVLENNVQTFVGCVALAKDPGGLPQTYADGTKGFSIRYPAGYTLDTSYVYQELGPGKDISGIKVVIPPAAASGTNLSSFDTGVSVEEIPNAGACKAELFVYRDQSSQPVTEGDTTYSVASTNGAGAGNFYEEQVWAIPDTNPCIAVRYFIHSMNIGNYTPGAVREFDKTALLNQFDQIRRSLILQ